MANFYRSYGMGLATGLLTLVVAGSANATDHNQTIGLVLGAAAGGLLGSQIGDGGDEGWRHDGNRGRRPDYKKYRERDERRWRHDHPRYKGRHYDYRRQDNFRHYRRDYSGRAYYQHDDDNSTQLIATAAGVFFGALIGSEIGRYMDEVDRMNARNANVMARTAPIGTRITWHNPDSYNTGTIAATRDGYSASGEYCREFYQTVSIGGRTQDAYGVACRQPDGAWRIIP